MSLKSFYFRLVTLFSQPDFLTSSENVAARPSPGIGQETHFHSKKWDARSLYRSFRELLWTPCSFTSLLRGGVGGFRGGGTGMWQFILALSPNQEESLAP